MSFERHGHLLQSVTLLQTRAELSRKETLADIFGPRQYGIYRRGLRMLTFTPQLFRLTPSEPSVIRPCHAGRAEPMGLAPVELVARRD